MSYSQYDEEPAILAAVAHIANGRLLDIGAYHPTTFSNSRALILQGWSAVMVEPSPEPFLSLLKEYGKNEKITLVNAALAPERGLLRMQATADAVSTTDAKSYEIWKDSAAFDGSFLTPTVVMGDLFSLGGAFDFVNVDTEGTNIQTLTELLKYTLPTCISIEHDSRYDEVTALTEPLGYRATLQNGTNWVLVR